MSPTQIAVLGAISGFTIYLGLPLGRLRAEMPRLKTFLNGTATGILIFLLWDVLAHAWEPIDAGLGKGELGGVLGNGAVLAGHRRSGAARPGLLRPGDRSPPDGRPARVRAGCGVGRRAERGDDPEPGLPAWP